MSRKRLIFLGTFILLLIFLPGYSRLQELRAKNRHLLEEIESLKKENKSLVHQIERLENDPFYIEKTARDRLGVVKKGEIRYKVIDEGEEPNE